jgi:6-phosphogluconolactonase
MKTEINNYASRTALDEALAEEIVSLLTDLLNSGETPHLLLSGGSTPINLYETLSAKNIDWEKIKIYLIDERFVTGSSPFSNEKMIREKLIKNFAAHADFKGMVYDETDYVSNLKTLEKKYEGINFSNAIILLGMGNDGHFASLFPNDFNSANGLKDDSTDLLNTNAPAEPIHRITFSGPAVCKAKHVLLMITGDSKLKVLKESEHMKLPIAYLLKKKQDMKIFYAE